MRCADAVCCPAPGVWCGTVSYRWGVWGDEDNNNNNNNNNVTLRTNTYRQSRLLFMISLGQTPPKSKSISLMDNAGMPGI